MGDVFELFFGDFGSAYELVVVCVCVKEQPDCDLSARNAIDMLITMAVISAVGLCFVFNRVQSIDQLQQIKSLIGVLNYKLKLDRHTNRMTRKRAGRMKLYNRRGRRCPTLSILI